MNFMQVETPEGLRRFFTNRGHFDVEPLGHAVLAALVTGTNTAIPLTLRDVYESDATGAPSPGGASLNVSFQLTYRGQVGFYGLVVGGWLPPLIGNGRVALLDRNMVHRLKTLPPSPGDHSDPDPESPEWLYQLFAMGRFEVSPAAHLLEGRSRRQPTLEEMTLEMQSLVAELKASLPNAKLHEFGPPELAALHALLLERQELDEKKTAFLVEVAPLLAHSVKSSARRALEDRVFAVARGIGLRRTELCVVAALSCIYEDPQLPGQKVYRPGRSVLKPKQSYSDEQAHNAAADLTSLELLVNSTTMLKDYRGVFFTEDVGLVAFWSALEAREPTVANTRPGKSQTTLTMTLSHALLPSLSEEQRADLAERLQEQ
jgi:hypothetical protein